MSDIPQTALPASFHTHTGFFPETAIHSRGGLYYQESSYSFVLICGFSLLAALIVFLSPWAAKTDSGYLLRHITAGFMAWGGICILIPYAVRNIAGQTIVINPKKRLLTIKRKGQPDKSIDWTDIIGLQIIRAENVYRTRQRSQLRHVYQLLLVWRTGDEGGAVQRHCLTQEAFQFLAVRLANQYTAFFRFPLLNGPTQTH